MKALTEEARQHLQPLAQLGEEYAHCYVPAIPAADMKCVAMERWGGVLWEVGSALGDGEGASGGGEGALGGGESVLMDGKIGEVGEGVVVGEVGERLTVPSSNTGDVFTSIKCGVYIWYAAVLNTSHTTTT